MSALDCAGPALALWGPRTETRATLTFGGRDYAFAEPLKRVADPAWISEHGANGDFAFVMAVIDEIGGPEIEEAVASMTRAEFDVFAMRLVLAIGELNTPT